MGLKLSTFMIGIVIISGFIVTFGTLYSNINTEYNTGYDNSTITELNKLENIKNISEQIENRHSQDTTNSDWQDVLGNLIADGIDIARLGANSYDAALQLKSKAFEELNIPAIWGVIAYVVIIILIFVAIILRIKVGQDV